MYFNQNIIESIKQNPSKGVLDVCNLTLDKIDDNFEEFSQDEHEILLEAFSLILGIIEAKILYCDSSVPSLSGKINEDCQKIVVFLNNVSNENRERHSQSRIEELKSQYKFALGSGFFYEFSKGDIDRIQKLLSELRDCITISQLLESNHKARLLKRLEKLQSELHKKIFDLDRFWGLVGDAGVAIGKLGNDAKPIVDRIREITNIIWRTQSRAEELPSDFPRPLLEDLGENEPDK